MDNILLDKLDTVINDFNNSEEVKEFTILKDKVLNNDRVKELLDRLNNLDNNSKEYKDIKKELFEIDDYKNYKHLENELYYFSLEASEKLSSLAR